MASDEDRQAVRALEAAYDAAWSRGDLDALVACCAPDVLVVTPTGEVASGRGEVRARLAAFLQGAAQGSRHSSTIIRIAFPTSDVAVVDGEARIERAGDDVVPRHLFTDILVKHSGRWEIAHVRAYARPSDP